MGGLHTLRMCAADPGGGGKITSFTTCNAGDIFFLILPLDAVYIYSRVTLISPPCLKDFNLITLNGN